MTTASLRIGTRASALAVAQARTFGEALQRAFPAVKPEYVEIVTTGDRRQGTARAGLGDKKEWIVEIEQELVDNRIDVAVHSSKDVPADIIVGTELTCVLDRANPHDAYVSRSGLLGGGIIAFAELRRGARIGTSSKRRRAQLARMRPDIEIVDFRGNVPTRIDKLRSDEALDGIVLAAAGLERLGLGTVPRADFAPEDIVPAVGQGTLVVQLRADDYTNRAYVKRLVLPAVLAAWTAEREVVRMLEADCRSALGIFGTVRGANLQLSARVLSADGRHCLEECLSDACEEAAALGRRVAEKLLARGATALLSSEA